MDLNNLNPEQIKSLIGLLSALLPTEEKHESDVPNKPTKLKTARSRTKGSSTNKFDKMPERNSHKADVEIDKKLIKYPPTERSRHFQYIEVKCRCCGKTEKVSPALVMEKDRYKCNKCSISAG